MSKSKSHEVGKYQYLAVAVGARAYSDGWNRDPAGYDPGNLGRYAFQHNGKRPGTFERDGVFYQLARSFHRLTLDWITPHSQHRLRRKPDVSHHRHFSLCYCLDYMNAVGSAL